MGRASLHPRAATLLAELGWPGRGPLCIGGVLASDLAARFGTPLYAYDLAVFRRRLHRLESAFGGRVRLHFALKANPLLAVARAALAAGCGLETASLGELEVALAAGAPPSAVRFAGPAKSEVELAAAARLGLASIDLESEAEYERLLQVLAGRRPSVALRYRPAAAAGGLATSGPGAKFGLAGDEVGALAERILREDRVELTGLHVYAGTQVLDAETWAAPVHEFLAFCVVLERSLGRRLRVLDLGGGFGVPLFAEDPDFAPEEAAALVRPALDSLGPGRCFDLEPGRWPIAPAGLYVCRVLEEKKSGDRIWLLTDGGLHHLAAAAGHGAVLRRRPFAVAVRDPGAVASGRQLWVGGPLCTPGDGFRPADPAPDVGPGSLLAVLSAGAYGLTFSPVRFLSHPSPAEVVAGDGRVRLARRRGRARDALRDQLPS